MKHLISISVFFILSTQIFSQVNKGTAPGNYEDSLSYAVGYDVARSLTKMDVKINEDWMTQGVIDALLDTSGSPILSDEQMESIFQALQRRNMEKMNKDADQVGVVNSAAGQEYVSKQMKSDTKWIKTKSGLVYKVIKKGNSKHPKGNDEIEVKYSGSLIDGTVFDQTGNTSTSFYLDGVIPGWTEGMQLIGEGGAIKLIIPAELAYGNNPPSGTPIQPGSTLLFDVELIKVGK